MTDGSRKTNAQPTAARVMETARRRAASQGRKRTAYGLTTMASAVSAPVAASRPLIAARAAAVTITARGAFICPSTNSWP